MHKNEVLVLHSGGIDSTAVINFFSNLNFNVTALHVLYGQAAGKYEAIAAKKICRYYAIKRRSIEIKAGIKFTKGLILGRNSFLLSTALLAGGIRKGQIALGIHGGTDYADCSKEFLNISNDIFSLYTNGKIIAAAPFIDWNKAQIFKYCNQESIPLNLTYSCELGLIQPCGKCMSCKELKILYGGKNK